MKNAIGFLVPFLAFAASLSAQQKGAAPLSTPLEGGRGVTRAVVVGISDYQDPAIPDLRFADRDAEAFANFLRSPAGGSLDADHLKLLTNQAATTAQFDAALGWLMDESKEGDQAIIYFSGHGDVETKTRSQQGFLLCWDSPPQAYVSGAYPIFFLKEVVSTLSLENRARVIIITDACRSGKLAGNAVGGSQLTSQNLAQQFANEIKILSCQPNEYSIEGEQWGGGRGAFSFHLVDGLYGMADGNSDASVNLLEIGRYLDDHVTIEVAPQSQVPMTVGNRTEKLAAVFPDLLAQVKKNKAGQLPTFSPTDSRGIEEDVLATVDTTVRKLYRMFKQALKDKVFLEPTDACADAYYVRLMAEPKLERLHNAMRRNFAAALQDDAQQVMNKWLKTDLSEISLSKKTATDKYLPYPRYLERAVELLGKEHYMYPVLQSRMHFFEGYLLALSSRNPDRALGEKALAQFRQALQWQAGLPQAYWHMSLVYGFNLLKPDSAEHYAQRAIELQPSWVLPRTNMAYLFSEKYGQFDRAKPYLEQASQLDSSSAVVWNSWGVYSHNRKAYTEAERYYKKAIQIEPTHVGANYNLGNLYTNANRYDEAEQQYKKAIQLDSTYADAYYNLANLYTNTRNTRRYDEAEQDYKKAIQLDSTFARAYNNLGNLYFTTQRYVEAEQQYKKVIQLDSTSAFAYYGLACIQSLQNQVNKAFESLELSLTNGYKYYDFIQQDTDLAPLRERTEQWQALMKNYFPDQVKD